MTNSKLMQLNDFYYAVQKMSDKEAMEAKNKNSHLLYEDKSLCGDDRKFEELKQIILINSLEDRGLFGKAKK